MTEYSTEKSYLTGDPYAVHDKLQYDPHPTRERLLDIMDRYHSNDYNLRDQAQIDMLGILSPYILGIINTKYDTYKKDHLEDLFAHAYEGVLIGMKTYDPEKGTPTTWFHKFIMGGIKRYIYSQVHHTSFHYYAAGKKVYAYIDAQAEKDIPCTLKDINIETGVPVRTLKNCIKVNSVTAGSISTGVEDLEIPTDYGDPERYTEQREASETIQRLILGKESETGEFTNSILDKYEQSILILYYGLDGKGRRNIAEIESVTGIPKDQIKRRIWRLLRRLRCELGQERWKARLNEINRRKQQNITCT
ncbi:MAG: hypothetical protein IJH81_03210 [Lachnospiraceae bacterium]|nr:hypothetical protein [Lachnospiraceae bacterium]MBQ6364420.1 hypothetical protein [Lachnospiraceae bacterium]MBQ6635362.1 hypothetical protein [Lachnospiraceae bacterium]